MIGLKKIYLLMLILLSCNKQEFSISSSVSTTNIDPVKTSSNQSCSTYTLVKPKVDILILFDNTSSFNFVTAATKSAMSNLITSISENFDYHLLTAPLVPAQNSALYDSTLVLSDPTSVTSNVQSIIKSKEAAVSSLNFNRGAGGAESGLERAYQTILNNRSNGIFRDNAYTIIVLMSNEDDKGCELSTGYSSCTDRDKDQYLLTKKKQLLCLRGNSNLYDCSQYPSLNSTMMRMISISPLTQCESGLNRVNYSYKNMSKFLYEANYTNGWPNSTDHLNPDVPGFFDSYNLCSINFSNIFNGVNSAIKQTLIKHVYNSWPIASQDTSVDPDTLIVTRDDGKILVNRTGESNPQDGYSYIGTQTQMNTRIFPTPGEPFTGKMIQLHGTSNNDYLVYPHCFNVKYQSEKSQFGYVYLDKGEPYAPSIEVTINGSIVPQDATNGWSYIGLQFISALDSQYKVAGLPAGASTGYFIKLNGSYKVTNANNVSIKVYYTSKVN